MRPQNYNISSTKSLSRQSPSPVESRLYSPRALERTAGDSCRFDPLTVVVILLSFVIVSHTRSSSPKPRNGEVKASPERRRLRKASENTTTCHDNNDETDKSPFTGSRYSPVIGRSVIEIRKLAKSALLGLLPHSIRYADLLAAGVDETTLRSLYEEIGIKVPRRPSAAVTETIMGQRQSAALSEPDGYTGDVGKDSTSLIAHSPLPHSSLPPIAVNLNKTQKENEEPSGKERSTLISTASTRSEEVEPAAAPSSLPQPNLPANNSSQSKTASSKPMERKEYIARMLAAKNKTTKVPSSTASSSQVQPAMKAQAKEITKPHDALPPKISSPENQRSVKPQINNTKTVNTEAIKQAQTNLARQKMEALMSRKTSHPELSSPSRIEMSTSQPPVQASAVSAPSTSVPTQQDALSQPSTTHSSIHLEYGVKPLADFSRAPVNLQPIEESVSTTPFSGIPGLFMTSAPLAKPQPITSPLVDVPKPSTAAPNPNINPRKRPLAADLNDFSFHATKRPFGQTRQTEVVIDVSDDDATDGADDSDMELEDTVEITTSKQSQVDTDTSASRSVREPPRLDDTVNRMSVAAASALNTPSAPPTPGKGKQPEDLRSREEQIRLMREKIAKLEQRQKSKQASSRADTPGTPRLPAATPVSVAIVPETGDPAMELKATNEPPDQENNQTPRADGLETVEVVAADEQPALEQKHLDPETANIQAEEAERAIADMVAKRRRKAEIESGLPVLDAEVQRTQIKLEEMKKEIQRLEAEVQKGLEGRQSLIEELESLGVDTQGMPLEELQARKSELLLLQRMPEEPQGKSPITWNGEPHH